MDKIAVLVLIAAAISMSYGSQRVVVAEEFTATWCVYCPAAARGLDQLNEEAQDSFVVIAYHSSSSDPFYTAEAASRATYYSLSGYPTAWFDGALSVVGGGYPNQTMYSTYRSRFNTRKAVDSPLEIELSCIYDSLANTGSVTANIQNTSAGTVTGTLQFALTETHIPYFWQCLDQLDFLLRDMLPDASGESVSIPAGDTIIRTRAFTVAGTWNERNCRIIAFVQASSREIYQGSGVCLIPEPHMQYYGMKVTETSGNGNSIIEPGESAEIRASAKNMWHSPYPGGATVQTSDPYITITGSSSSFDTIGFARFDTVVTFTIDVSPSCPDPQLTSFDLNFGLSVDTMPFMVTTDPGFSDDIESGTNGWTLHGLNNNWHVTQHKSHSLSHSWYCGLENSWQYTNNNNSSLISPYFVVTPDSVLRFWHQYSLETSFDFGYVEVDNGSNFWKEMAEFNGTLSSWTQASYSLASYSSQTIRIRFHFTSDGAVVQEGWYMDDIMVPALVGVEENAHDVPGTGLALWSTPNLFSGKTVIRFQLADHGKAVRLDIYDSSGRLVRHWEHSGSMIDNQVVWTGVDDYGRQVNSGIYFVRLTDGKADVMAKIIRIE